MHELSIALEIIDIVANESQRYDPASVTAVHVRVGPLSGVVAQSLAAAYELAREGTKLENCQLVIEEAPLILHCRECGKDGENASIQLLRCSKCGSNNISIVGGRDLEVAAVEVEA
jgi:hydrogenase nickel incorporation protein HypA/HybF